MLSSVFTQTLQLLNSEADQSVIFHLSLTYYEREQPFDTSCSQREFEEIADWII